MNRWISFALMLGLGGAFACGDDDGVIPELDGSTDMPTPPPDVQMDIPERPDLGPRMLAGAACTTARGCIEGECNDTGAGTIPWVSVQGGMLVPGDTIEGLDMIPQVGIYPEGFCSIDCDDDAACGLNGVCIRGDASTPQLEGTCYQSCTYNRTDNGGCRDGFSCFRRTGSSTEGFCEAPFFAGAAVTGVCGGPMGDTMCKVERRETNGIEGIQQPFACAQATDGSYPCETATSMGMASLNNYDRRFYNEDNPSTCNQDTGYCMHPGNDAASVGDMCVEDWDCPTEAGLCLTFDVNDAETSYLHLPRL